MQSVLERIKSIPGRFILKEELSSNLITKIYLCSFNDTQSVIRFDLPVASKLAINRQHEVNILDSIKHLDLAPKILYSDTNAGILIWKYISGSEPNFIKETSKPNSLFDLGASLALLHSSPIPKNSIDIFSNSMLLYENLLQSSSEKLVFKRAMALYKELEKDGARKVFSHNDLHQKNLLWNKKYYFLDWEYSGPNHPCFDIASLVKSFELNPHQINELSLGYKTNKNFFHPKALNPWVEFVACLEEIWKIAVIKISTNHQIQDTLT